MSATFHRFHAKTGAALCALVALGSSCASTAQRPTDDLSGADSTAGAAADVVYAVTAAPSAHAPASAVAAQWTELDLTLWSTPAFRRRFTESYIAETEIEPRVTEQERNTLQQVVELMGEGKVDRAVSILQKNSGEGASAVFDFTLANVYFEQEELYQASVSYKLAVDRAPKFRRAWRNLALVHVRRGEFREAAAAFSRVIELGGGDGITYGLLGYAYTNLEQHMSAESAYRMALLLDPVTPDWSMGLARSFFKQKRFAEAITLCSSLIAKDPDRAELWLLQANAYIGLEQPMRAAENFEVVAQMGASNYETHVTLGNIYVNAELPDLAVANYLQALEIDPQGNLDGLLRSARVLSAQGAQDDCVALIEGIESVAKERLTAGERKELLRIRARIAAARGAGEQEVQILEELITLDPLDGDALILLGQHYGREGELERAAFLFERAAGIEAFDADAKGRHAQMLVVAGRSAEAVPLLMRAQTVRPRENIQRFLEQVERAALGR